MDDAELVAAIRNGDQSAWEELVDRHSSLLWRLARAIVNDDDLATDAMQTAWMRLLENVDRLSNPAGVRSWLATTARREAIALSKAATRQRATDPHAWSLDVATEGESGPAAQVADNERRSTVLAEFRSLSERCRELLTMLAHKIAYEEISSTMDMAVGSIGPTRRRCLDELRALPGIRALEVV